MAQTLINCGLILTAAAILLYSLVKNSQVQAAVHLVRREQQRPLRRYLLLHHGLIVFFLFGYLLEVVAILCGLTWVSETFVSIIFFFGALFVFIGIDLKTRLLGEVQSTLHGILPICARCKKIRVADAGEAGRESWENIECYISEKAAVSFSHGFCPVCFAVEMRQVEALQGAERRPMGH
ncbi:MAG: hypothetical protein QNJ22_07580 [Desulfosarcinaceae bacterium]|nr:hypothetical protein [Desulfosarcinaceae bacterium]